MPLKRLFTAALVAFLPLAPAVASPLVTVTAEYDPFFTANASISVTNDTAFDQTNVTIFSGASSQLLGTIAPGATVTYVFNDPKGPFIIDPADAGLPDTTIYDVSAVIQGMTLTSNSFSAVKNLTGQYVDFLGACYRFSSGCSADPFADYPLSGVVAEISTTPPPGSFALFGSALAGFAVLRRRYRQGLPAA